MRSYPVNVVEDDNDTFFVTSPDFPEVATFGDTYMDALDHARGAIEEAIAARLVDRDSIPAPGNGNVRVAISLQIAIKADLWRMLKAKKIRRADLVRELNWKRESVERLFKPNHKTQLEQFDAVYRALGAEIDFKRDNDLRA